MSNKTKNIEKAFMEAFKEMSPKPKEKKFKLF